MSNHDKSELIISLLQADIIWENKEKNLSAFTEKIEALNHTDVIILPEMFSTGFSMNAKNLSEEDDGKTLEWMRNISIKKNCALSGSVIIREGDRFFNRLYWITPDQKYHYDKRHLFSHAKENETYSPGKKILNIDYKGWKICPLICYDLRFPVWSRRSINNDYDLLIYIANWPEKRITAWKSLLQARAIENQSYVAGVNRIGKDAAGFNHSGESAVYDFSGEKILEFSDQKPLTASINLNKNELIAFREKFNFAIDADEFKINLK